MQLTEIQRLRIIFTKGKKTSVADMLKRSLTQKNCH